jgi:hypothetical protein
MILYKAVFIWSSINVANSTSALYSLTPLKTPGAMQGRAPRLYKRFDTVVQLRMQIRVKDAVWTEILGRLRVGRCTPKDLCEIRKLRIGQAECPPMNFQIPPWSDAILVTTRHSSSVRDAWNAASLTIHCCKTGHIKYIVLAEDYIKGSNPNL